MPSWEIFYLLKIYWFLTTGQNGCLRWAGGRGGGVEGGMCIVQTITWFTRISPNGIICKSRKGRTFFKANDT